jgi:peptidoglycan/xylan/chitin deacetylase (PgdA/CDA1 family)
LNKKRQQGGHRLAKAAGNILSPGGDRARLVVFCYHQVLERHDPLRPGEPDEAQFLNDVELIDSVFNVLPFTEAARSLKSGSLPRRSACITFDDGYANNFELAAPVLQSVGVPATFFIAGGAVDTGVMWNDLVIESVAHSGLKEEKENLAAILGELKYRPMAERWDAAVHMYQNTVGADLPRLMMTRDMVADLSAKGFEVAGHTINHPILKELSDDEAQLEIEDCATWIRDVTGDAPTSFAYPNGVPGQDYTSTHSAMVQEAGFEAAASTQWALAHRGIDPFSIPRVGPWWRQGRTLTSGLCRSYLKSYLAG